MQHDELAAWLRLSLTPGIGPDSGRRLLAAFGLPQDIFRQPAQALRQVVGPAATEALASEPPGLAAQLELTWHWLQERTEPTVQRQVVALGDPAYPGALLNIEDPPLLLYLMGRLDLPLVAERSLAIVGSRNPTPQGTLNARQFAHVLGEAGLTIVSGLALGVDGAAHQGALDGRPGADQRLATIAVVGTGLDRVYPKSHLQLAHRIAQHGLLVSEYPLGTPPLAANFPRRNRLIAGLSSATLVVEAALQSGSLITARLAAEQGKEVFAIPGSIHAAQSRGCHALIRQGAKLVESAQDVLEDLQPVTGLGPATSTPAHQAPADENAAPDPLLVHLGFDPVSLDALQARTGLDTAALQARLMGLELEGQLARLPGGLFQRLVQT
jgi:DNA processing protein